MTGLRIIALALFVSALAIFACGGGGSGGSGGSGSPGPALGTNKPAQSGDPYSDYGY